MSDERFEDRDPDGGDGGIVVDRLVCSVQIETVDVLVASEVAALLRMNVKTIYDLAKTGEIPSWRLGRHFRFSRPAIVALLGQCKSAPHREGK